MSDLLVKQLSGLTDDIKRYVSTNDKRFGEIQRQMDTIDASLRKSTGFSYDGGDGNLRKAFTENESLQRLIRDKRGSATIVLEGKDARLFESKTTITSGAGGTVGSSTSGVLQIGRLPDITMEARQQLTVRDVLTATPTTFQLIDFVKVNTPMTIASPVAEAALKPEENVSFVTQSERVRTIAAWQPASRQLLEDMTDLMGFIENTLAYYVDLAEEIQLLSGDGTGENLHGLIPQASAFQTSLLIATRGWNKIDQIGRAMQQVTAAKELQPTFVIMHPNDWFDIRLTKDNYGRYILGDPQDSGIQGSNGFALRMFQSIFGLRVVATTSIASGTFLVGSGSPIATEIKDRMQVQIDVSTEHSTFFTQNLIAVRGEKRLALVTRRPGSFVTGQFSNSPL